MKIDIDTGEEILMTLTRNKTRSFLTAFGVFWGIFMLIALTGGGQALEDMMKKNFKGFATNSGFLAAQRTGEPYKGFRKERWWRLETSDIERLKQNIPELETITGQVSEWGQTAVYQEKTYACNVKGVYPEQMAIEEPKMVYGRFINEMDIRERRKVCVIGRRVCEGLLPAGEDPCGKLIRVRGVFYQIVGMDENEGNLNVQGSASESVTLPITTMQQTYNMDNRLHVICFTARQGVRISDLQPRMEQIVKAAHLISPTDRQAVMFINAEALFSMVDNLFTGIGILVWMVGLGTLLAGAIGVSNIMMVTVRERTVEIGIRRAIGARPRDILQQILLESISLTVVAGVLGVAFGVMMLQLAESHLGGTGPGAVRFQISFGLAVGSCALLVALGMLAGLAPAFRAMAVRPIEAMRDE